jgi:hypothetical protein
MVIVGTEMTGMLKVCAQRTVFGIATREAAPRAEIMNDDRHVIRIFNGRRGALVRGIIEAPFRREPTPPEFVEIV